MALSEAETLEREYLLKTVETYEKALEAIKALGVIAGWAENESTTALDTKAAAELLVANLGLSGGQQNIEQELSREKARYEKLVADIEMALLRSRPTYFSVSPK